MMLWLDLILEPASIDAVKLARCLFGIWLERTGRGCAWLDQNTTRQESERCRTVGAVRHRRREFSSFEEHLSAQNTVIRGKIFRWITRPR